MSIPTTKNWNFVEHKVEWLKYKESQSDTYKLNVSKKIWAKFLKVFGLIAKIVIK